MLSYLPIPLRSAMLRSRLSAGPSPEALLRSRIREVFRQLPGALAGQEEPVHQLRVSGRRLRVALPLVARKPEGRRPRRALRLLRRLTRVAGRSRDLDVCIAQLEEHARAAGAAEEVRLLSKRLKAARRRTHATVVEDLLDLEIATLRRDLRSFLARGPAAPEVVLARLRHERDRLLGAMRSSLDAVAAAYDPPGLHRLRRLVRRLRYAAEAADQLLGRESEAPKVLQALQERLGSLYDAHVLVVWLSSRAKAAERRSATELAAETRRLAAAFDARSREQHALFLGEDPGSRLAAAVAGMALPIEAGHEVAVPLAGAAAEVKSESPDHPSRDSRGPRDPRHSG
jgi:CHAD domain-containing protein